LFMRIVPILRDVGLWGLRRHRYRRRDGRGREGGRGRGCGPGRPARPRDGGGGAGLSLGLSGLRGPPGSAGWARSYRGSRATR
jgi:hypothetical protein